MDAYCPPVVLILIPDIFLFHLIAQFLTVVQMWFFILQFLPISSDTSDPYCLVSMGGQENKTKVVLQNLNPVWDSSMQFIVRDLEQDLLCITVYDKDLFTPDGKIVINVDVKVVHCLTSDVGKATSLYTTELLFHG